MGVFSGFIKGVGAYSKAFRFILNNNLARFFIYPLVLNIVLFLFGYSWIISLSDYLKSLIETCLYSFDFVSQDWFNLTISFILKSILGILYFISFMFFGGYIIVAIMSPVFAIISEKTEEILSGHKQAFNFKQFIEDVFRGLFLAVRNSIMQLVAVVILFFVSFIPVIGFITPLVIFLISAYFFGFSFLDYTIERKRYGIKDSVNYMRNNKGLVIGNGFIFALLLLVPLCGVFLSAFVAIVSVVSGTILVEESISNQRIN